MSARESASVAASASPAELITAARAGDERAWAALVRRLQPSLRSVARRYGLSPAQADDVVQTAWMRLVENIGSLRAPEAVGAWLAVTVRREAFRALQGHVREHLTDEPFVDESAGPAGLDHEVLHAEQRTVLARAIETLPARHQQLMELLLREPGIDYREVSVRTGIPTGSIGPIRGRCLVRMADDPAVRALRD
jgi:RNA polymerase sigma factor (sigma-70 family)